MHERNLIQIQSLADNIESFLTQTYQLNHQLAMDPRIINTITSSEPDWEKRVRNYGEMYPETASGVAGMDLLQDLMKEYSWVELFFVQDINGNQTARSSGMIGPRGDRWWFKKITEAPSSSPFISKSYYSMTGNKPVASVFHPIYQDETLVGIMGTDINFNYLQEMVSGYLYSEDLEAIVVDSTGTVIAHPDRTFVNQLYNLIDKTKNVLSKNSEGEILQDDSGYHVTTKVSTETNRDVSSAAERVLKGEGGFIKNSRIDGELCSIYYEPAFYPGADVEDIYGLLLIYNHNRLIVFTRILIIGIILFILISTFLLYLFFHRLFQDRILNPLSLLVDFMGDRNIIGFRAVKLDTGDEFDLLAETYNSLRTDLATTHQELQENMENLAISEEGYRTFAGISLSMTGEKQKQEILKIIIRQGMDFCNAEGGTLYLYDIEKSELTFEIIYNDILDVHKLRNGENGENLFQPVPVFVDGKPNNTNVSSYCAITGEIISIPDVYHADGFDFEGMKNYDSQNQYTSKSMLVLPMKNLEGEIIGVLQLINARDDRTREVCEFTEHHRNIVTILASQGAVTLTNIQLNKNLEEFLYSFIQSIAAAVDEKFHYTSGHIERVVSLSGMIADRINTQNSGVYANIEFTAEEIEELRIAAWMHDVGKISIPEDVLDKSSKLMFSRDGYELIEMRGRRISLLWENSLLKDLLSEAGVAWEDSEGFRVLHERISVLDEDLKKIRYVNEGHEFLSEEDIKNLSRISQTSAAAENGTFEDLSLLTPEELRFLSIRKGTLDEHERAIIESHVHITRKILDKLQFPSHLSNVPNYASQHHEKLDGSGYDQGLDKQELPLQSRIIAVSDIFEALTAQDRPYRKPIKLETALLIMRKMCDANYIDKDIFNILVETEILGDYCKRNGLDPDRE
ncbi:MAG: GAF domain-containing protein [Spirochaetales bacterium]|nr:GAF domain-containing protein [Spirochaetales bacterium]